MPTRKAWHLTSREVEVMALKAAGLTSPEVAAKLVMSEGTVKTHIQRVYTKLDVHTIGGAVAICVRKNLIPLYSEDGRVEEV